MSLTVSEEQRSVRINYQIVVVVVQLLKSDRDVYSHPLFNMFLERIMTGALEDHEGIVSIGGKTITTLRFAYDIDGLAEEEELVKLVERLDNSSTAYSMKISAEKTKLIITLAASTRRSR